MTAKDKVWPVMKVSGENAGSQIIHTIVSAPATTYTPYVILSALRFIKAAGGAVSVVGA
jgi:hypothetical protein